MTQRSEKYTTAVLQVLNLNDMPLLFALVKTLNETLPNTDIPVLLLFLSLSLCFVLLFVIDECVVVCFVVFCVVL
jgi:hypothetical protein